MYYRVYTESPKRHFDQWDKGQRLVIEGIPAGTNVDFSPYKNEVYMRKAYAEGSSVYVNVPDVALQKSGVLKHALHIQFGNYDLW